MPSDLPRRKPPTFLNTTPMSETLSRIEAALSALPFPDKPAGLYEPIAYALASGGKRIRPTLLLTAYSLYRDDPDAALPAALALEIFHNSTLLHDDLMDNAAVRRGRPSVHRRWDANTAILSGDTMLILSFAQACRCRCRRQADLMQLFARTMQEVCEGQQYDMNFETRTDVTEAEYIEMIRLKTSVLLACALQMGALVADAPRADADLLYRLGEKLGIAFQLQDDYLDCYGDPAVFGKAIGGDILCGKKTFLLINALRRSTDEGRTALLALLTDTSLPPADKVERVKAIYDRLGIPALTLARIDGLFAEARQLFDALPVAPARKQPLWDLAAAMLRRER